MPPTLRTLLEHVIDYAGLFLPANLPLDESVANYLAYQTSPRAWMLGGFVCPARRLEELADTLSTYEGGSRALGCCVIARPADGLAQAAETLREDLRHMSEFAQTVSQSAASKGTPHLSLEFHLPSEACSADAQLGVLLDGINRAATELDVPLGSVFLETRLDKPSVASVAEGVSGFPRRGSRVFGLKFRTGGLDALAYPSGAALAHGIAICRDRGLPYKLTAGLHRPFRHAEPALGTDAHGFLNVLIAAALAEVHRELPPCDIQAMLEEESAEDFAFTATELRWRTHTASVAQIGAARRHGLRSFGSCSFDEPVEGLRALGWPI